MVRCMHPQTHNTVVHFGIVAIADLFLCYKETIVSLEISGHQISLILDDEE